MASILTSHSWIQFLENIKQAQTELHNPDILWFRGHGNIDHYLLPSLLRYANGLDKEQELFHKFQRFSERLNLSRKGEWETLFDMQHYYIPTRLLDWTETLGIALYFAVYSNKRQGNKHDAAIYLLDPVGMNKVSGKSNILRLPYDTKDFSYPDIYWHKKPFAATAPIAVEPLFQNERIMAQRGMFTVFHDDIDPIEKKFPKEIKKVRLPLDAIPAAEEFLKIASIDEFSVFPDLSGLADHLNRTSGLIGR
jgi:hypothetical protein